MIQKSLQVPEEKHAGELSLGVKVRCYFYKYKILLCLCSQIPLISHIVINFLLAKEVFIYKTVKNLKSSFTCIAGLTQPGFNVAIQLVLGQK